MTQLDIDEIERRADAATAGPWRSHWGDQFDAELNDVPTVSSEATGLLEDERMVVGVFWHDGAHAGCSEVDAKFIAHARSDIPLLCQRVRELEAENERLRQGQFIRTMGGVTLTPPHEL